MSGLLRRILPPLLVTTVFVVLVVVVWPMLFEPYEKVVQQGYKLIPSGTDETILAQRKAFLRPDSLVAIVMLSDEKDCSIALGAGAAKIYGDQPMVRARPECAADPNDPCCAPCDDAPAGCAEEAECKDAQGNWARLAPEDDSVNLRCFDQKRRFGKSYLYPTSRYAKGLTDLEVLDQKGNLVPNPLYVDLDPEDDIRGQRTKGLVFLAGIVGVPWQDIAKDPTTLVKGLMTAKERAVREMPHVDAAFADVDRITSGLSFRVRVNQVFIRLMNDAVTDLVTETSRRLADLRIASLEDVRERSDQAVGYSAACDARQEAMHRFLFDRFYSDWRVARMQELAKHYLREVSQLLIDHPRALPPDVRATADREGLQSAVKDHVASMTDRELHEEYRRIVKPGSRVAP